MSVVIIAIRTLLALAVNHLNAYFHPYSNACRKNILPAIALLLLFILVYSASNADTGRYPPGVPDLSHPDTRLSIVIDSSIADNISNNSIKAHIVDADGVPVQGVNVNFQWDPGGSNVTVGVTTDINGDAIFYLASSLVGQVSVYARVGGVLLSNNNPVKVTYVAYQPDVTVSTTRLEVVTTGAVADGSATNTVKAIITDADGNPVANQTVNFQLSSGTANFTTPVTVTTDANGEAFISMNSTIAGNVDITADVNGTPLVNNSPATVQFTADVPSVAVATTFIDVLANGAIANGVATNSVRAHITDANGNPVPGEPVTFTITSGTATPTGSFTVYTDASGNAVLDLTSNVANIVTLTADVNGSAIVNGSPLSIEFVVDAPDATAPTTKLQVVTTGAIANNSDINTVKAIITDANGNPVAGQIVKFTIASGTASFAGPNELATDANGEAVINLYTAVAGPVDITATINNTNIINGSPAGVLFVADVPDMSHPDTQLKVNSDSADADGISTNQVSVHVVDANGNPVPGQTVTFTITGGIAFAGSPISVMTDSNGDAVFSFYSNVIGTVTITATINTAPVTNGSPASSNFIAYADVTKPETSLFVMADNAAADGIAENAIRAHVVDNAGYPMSGQKVVFSIATGRANILTPQPVVTDASGDAVMLLNSQTAGSVTVTAAVENKLITFGSPARVRFTIEDVWVPKVFTPNGDGLNDVIRPINNGNFRFEYFNIYNRWGNLVFSSNDINKGWDGRLKGVVQPNETYLWNIGGFDSNNKRVLKRGMLSLVR